MTVLFIGLAAGCSQEPATSIELDGEWLYRLDPTEVGKAEQWVPSEYPKADWQPMRIRKLDDRRGQEWLTDAVWLSRRFEANLVDSAQMLLFGNVYGELGVWLNGTQVGVIRSHGDVYTCDVSNLFQSEGNELVVRLGAGGGLYGPVAFMQAEKLPEALRSSYSDQSARVSADWIRDAVIYEISVRSFSAEGTFGGVERKVKELRDFGASVLLLMPIHPIGDVNRQGSLGNPTAVQDFYGVSPEFGTLEEFRTLVEAVHRHGMKILIDLPANRAAWDSKIMFENPEWFMRDESGAIVSPDPRSLDVAELNYEHHDPRRVLGDREEPSREDKAGHADLGCLRPAAPR